MSIPTGVEYSWQKARNASHEYLVPVILRALRDYSVPKGAQILDAGCGGGYVMHKLVESGFHEVWGFDSSMSGIHVARTSFGSLQERVRVHNAYEKDLPAPFPANNYRVILSVEVIEHLYAPKTYLQNISSWLSEDGHLIITTPYHGFLKNLAIALTNSFDRHVDPLNEGGHIKLFSRSTLERILQSVGFRSLDFYGCGRVRYLWKSMIMVARKA